MIFFVLFYHLFLYLNDIIIICLCKIVCRFKAIISFILLLRLIMNIFFLFLFIILSKIFKIFSFVIIIHMNRPILWHLCYINLEILSIPIIITELINRNFLVMFVHSLCFSCIYYFLYIFIKIIFNYIKRKGDIIF